MLLLCVTRHARTMGCRAKKTCWKLRTRASKKQRSVHAQSMLVLLLPYSAAHRIRKRKFFCMLLFFPCLWPLSIGLQRVSSWPVQRMERLHLRAAVGSYATDGSEDDCRIYSLRHHIITHTSHATSLMMQPHFFAQTFPQTKKKR